MRIRNGLLLAAAVVSTFALTPIAEARGKKAAVTEAGKYQEWGPDIDEIEIVKPFKVADYTNVTVEKFDTSAAPLPESGDRTYDAVKTVLESYTDTLTEALRDELKSGAKVEQAATAPKASKTLILRGKVEDVSPGSRAGRMMVGYGAGSAATKISGEIVDAKSGNVLVRFTQKRRSGGTFKFAGGGDVAVMRDAIHAAGKDIAHILDAFE